MAVNLRFNRDNSTLSANGVENGSARVLRRIPLTERLISLSRTITNRTPAYFEPGNSKKKKKTSPSKRLRDAEHCDTNGLIRTYRWDPVFRDLVHHGSGDYVNDAVTGTCTEYGGSIQDLPRLRVNSAAL